MKLAVALVVLALAGFVETAQESKAQTVRDNSGGRTYFENAVKALCGSRAHVSVSSDSAFIFLSGECVENRNLNEIARNLALDGLNAFPDSELNGNAKSLQLAVFAFRVRLAARR